MNLSGNPSDYLIAFTGGVLVSFTPCVYPLVPVSASYIGVTSGGSRWKGLGLSLVYVTGLAVTYSILGLIAALTGNFFGEISSHPVTNLFVGVVVVIFGMAMLDIFHISIPHIYRYKAHKKHNFLSTFFLGMSSGLVASPCLTPVLGSILLFLSTKRSVVYGMSLLFVFAYGMGFILILAGTFSSVLVGFPKLGKWMTIIKRGFAVVLIGVGLFIIVSAIRRMI
jgi:cytochrome c-type biogenesis protein